MTDINSNQDSQFPTQGIPKDPEVLLAETKKYLNIPKQDRKPDWESYVSRLIGLICLDFPKQESNDLALAEIVIVQLAGLRGNKEAKKRILSPTRWISIPPPSLSQLFEDQDEAQMGIRALKPINAPWVIDYIINELETHKWPSLTPDLLDWLLSRTVTVEEFLYRITQARDPSNICRGIWLKEIVEILLKLITKFPQPLGKDVMSVIANFADQISSAFVSQKSRAEKNETDPAQLSVLELINYVTSIEPATVITSGMVNAIDNLRIGTNPKLKQILSLLEQVGRRLLNVMTLILPFADAEQTNHLKAVWKTYSKNFADARKILDIAIKNSASLNLLLVSGQPSMQGYQQKSSSAIESIFCSLLPNWDDYYSRHKGMPDVDQINLRIEDLAQQLKLKRLGNLTEIENYDPFRHQLLEASSSLPLKVTIRKPGVVAIRDDGSERVLLKAIVASIG